MEIHTTQWAVWSGSSLPRAILWRCPGFARSILHSIRGKCGTLFVRRSKTYSALRRQERTTRLWITEYSNNRFSNLIATNFQHAEIMWLLLQRMRHSAINLINHLLLPRFEECQTRASKWWRELLFIFCRRRKKAFTWMECMTAFTCVRLRRMECGNLCGASESERAFLKLLLIYFELLGFVHCMAIRNPSTDEQIKA